MKVSNIKNIGKDKLLLLCAAGIILIVVSYCDIGSDKKEQETAKNDVVIQTDYAGDMEKKVKKLIGSIDGVSDVQVVLTLKTGNEKVVKEDLESNNKKREEQSGLETENSVKKTTVLLSDEGNESPYIIKEIYPQVQGIAVAAKGVSDIQTKNSIINMLAALFDIPVHKITVIEI